MRKLYRHSRGEKHVVGGVFSGVGEWLEVSPGIIRAGFIIFLIISGIIPAILLYLAAMLLIKKHPEDKKQEESEPKVIDIE